MIQLDTPINSTLNIIHPVSEKIVFNFLEQLGMYNTFKDNIYINHQNTASSDTGDEFGNIEVIRDKLDCNVDPSFDPTNVKWKNSRFSHIPALRNPVSSAVMSRPIFADTDNDIYLFEANNPFMMKLDVSATFTDREEAYGFPSALRMKHSGKGTVYDEDVVYDYVAPLSILGLLKRLYSYVDSSEAFNEWMAARCTRLAYRTNPNTKKREFTIKQVQTRAIASVEYGEAKPEVIKKDDLPIAYVVKFTIFVQMDKPDLLKIQYPPIIRNKRVREYPKELETARYRLDDQRRNVALEYLHDSLRHNFRTTMYYPIYDMWAEPLAIGRMGFRSFMTLVFYFGKDENGELLPFKFNLNEEVKGYTLLPSIRSFISEHRQSCVGFNGQYDVSVFCDDSPINPAGFTIDEDLNITVDPQYALDGVHRLVISERVGSIDKAMYDHIKANLGIKVEGVADEDAQNILNYGYTHLPNTIGARNAFAGRIRLFKNRLVINTEEHSR